MRRLIPLMIAAALTCDSVYLYATRIAAANRPPSPGEELTPPLTVPQARRTAKQIEQKTPVRIDDLAKRTEKSE